MKKQTYNIKITGLGSKQELISALSDLMNSIENTSEKDLSDTQFEDSILYTEIELSKEIQKYEKKVK